MLSVNDQCSLCTNRVDTARKMAPHTALNELSVFRVIVVAKQVVDRR